MSRMAERSRGRKLNSFRWENIMKLCLACYHFAKRYTHFALTDVHFDAI